MAKTKTKASSRKAGSSPVKHRPPKKKPGDYPQMAFRISSEDKAKLNSLIADVHRLANAKVASDRFKVRKNELIVDALWKGLLDIKKNHRRF